MKNLTGFIHAFLITLLAAGFVSFATGASPYLLFGIFSLAAMVIKKPNHALYGVTVENWVKYIIERFWRDNQFLKFAYNDDQYIINGKIVHIPQPGSLPEVVMNRSSLPASVSKRTDTDITYIIDEYTTSPTLIPNADLYELSYNKMDSVLGDHMSALSQAVADAILYKWASSGNVPVLKTTGGTGSVQVAPLTGQVGNRLAFSYKDLQAAALRFDSQNVPTADRYALLDVYHYDQLLTSLSEGQYRDFSRYMDAEKGIVGMLFGFYIIKRSSVVTTASDDTVNAVGAALSANDNIASLVWHKNSVTRAIGDRQLFQRPNDPQYYGDVYSLLLRAGSRVRRANAEGIAVITQGVPQA